MYLFIHLFIRNTYTYIYIYICVSTCLHMYETPDITFSITQRLPLLDFLIPQCLRKAKNGD